MDRSALSGNSDFTDLEIAANDASSSQADPGAFKVPGRREIIEIEVTRGTATGLFDFVLQHGAKATVTTDGLLGFRFADGGLIVLRGSAGIPEAFDNKHGVLIDLLNSDPALLAAVIGDLERGGAGTGPLDQHLPQDLEFETADQPIDGFPIASGSSYGPVTSIPDTLTSEAGLAQLDPAALETRRWGRDDIKRGEAGSSGRLVDAPVGSALSHLTGLGDEEPGHRNGEKIASSNNGLYVGPETPVGASLDHLWLLGDIEYIRASRDIEEGGDVFESGGYQPIIWAPIVPITDFGSVEDTVYSGNLFDPSIMPLPITTWQVTLDPTAGTVTFGPKGEFVFTPVPGYSGTTSFDYSFRDPRTGLTISGTVDITVQAVADPATISGSAQTDEDMTIATPVSISFNDPDGSEDFEQVVITDLPAGATLGWDTGLPGSIVQQPDGSFLVTGASSEIEALLLSLTVTPPQDFHGRITLGIDVTTIERNVDPALPGYEDRETVHFDYHIDVEAVADPVTATGDDETTDEDTLVHLNDLAATFGDAIDGSETHVVEIRGVNADAKNTDSSGAEYPFTVAGDGTKTYTLTPAQVPNVYFLPPPDESGLFDGMTIVAIATEGSNGDQEVASAPISVLVNPVADPVTLTTPPQATDEDTAVVFGDDISIVINDPLTQTLTQVVVSGFPAGTIVTYTPAGGGPDVTQTMPANGSVTFAGTEAEIRAALATLTLTPPEHTDQNITLMVAATTEDLGGVTDTQTSPMIITVAAVADGPTISGSASGNEDQPIALPITVSRIDADGSEQYDFAEITVPSGVSLIYPATLPNGITVSAVGDVYTFTPGAATTALQFQSFLATGLQVQAPADSDLNFDVDVRVGTIESVLSGGELTLLRAEDAVQIPVVVRPVTDMPTVTGSSTVDEDTSVTFGANIAISENDKTDGSESITQIVLGNIPATATVTYTTSGSVTVTAATAAGITTYTITGGTEDEIRATLATFTLTPPLHSDVNIPVSIAITKVDQTTSEGESAATTTSTYSHTIAVAAVADAPSGSGSGAGLEDQNIPVLITVSHPDNTDGTERIKDVIIGNIPSGFTLSESSAGTGTLTLNGNGTYTVSGSSTAAIQDVLSNLSLVFVPGGARQHLDTEFNLSVRVTSIESAPTETGAGEVAVLETFTDFTVPVTVSAVADGVTKSGASVIVEDVARTVGGDIQWTKIDSDGTEFVTEVVVSAFPAGTTVSWTDTSNTLQSFVSTGTETVTLSGAHSAAGEAAIRTALSTLTGTAPPHSDTNLTLNIAIRTTDNDASATTQNFTHTVVVQAVADTPSVTADSISLDEDTSTTLTIRPDRSADDDNSETLSVRITVPADGGTPVGALSGTSGGGVTFTNQGGGVYLVTATGATPAARETALDTFLNGGITFTPRANYSGEMTGTNGIRVEAISTENATLYGNTTMSPDDELAPNNSASAGTSGDLDTRIEIATTYINVTVNPINDIPTATNTSTVVQENTGLSDVNDPDLVIPIGTRIGLTIADTDGSQGLALTLTGFPVNAQALAFGTSIGGVTTTVNIATGTVTLSGTNANAVITVLNSLSVTLADDRDENFTVTIDGTVTDTNGATTDTDTFTLTHAVTVQAVADLPTVNVGAATKPAVNEDSGFVTYAVTTALNDADGSETYQSVMVAFSTPGAGARPEVQFGTTSGVTFDASTPGQVVLTGTAAAINAAMASLQVQPGANNGEDITVSVTAIAVESNPAEDNNGATIGMGGGVAGPEISVPTAQAVASFTIPVTPVPEVPTLNIPASASGAEDNRFALGAITVSTGTSDGDGSESRFFEIQQSSYPVGTQFFSGPTQITSVVGGWLRVTEAQLANLSVQPPTHYSGTINLTVRGVVVDTNAGGSITSTTATQTLPVTVTPDADGIVTPAASVVVEDTGAFTLGSNINSGLSLVDNGTGTGNNGTSETISRIALDFPDDSATVTYSISPGAAVGSAQIAFDAGTRTYTITSTIITGAPDVGALTQTDRAQAEADIRATLAGFNVTMGPTHSDTNGTVAVTVTTLDVNGGVANAQDNPFSHSIRVQAVADTPSVSVVDPVSAVDEDGPNVLLTINAGNSADVDNSETLSVRITVPSDGLGPIGTIVGTTPSGVTLTHQGGGVYLVTATGANNAAREAALDGFLNGGGVAFNPRDNWSGVLTGTNGIRVDVISTEGATGSELAPGSFGGLDGTSATETVTDYIDIRVIPVADAPTVKGNGVGLEDARISVPMSVTLSDKDGSESYAVRLTAVIPPGTQIFGAGGVELLPVSGIYNLTAADVAALAVQPPQHYSSALSGDIVLTAETLVTDTSNGNSDPTTLTTNIRVSVTGVADAPGTRTVDVVADEDEAIELGAAILASAGGNLNSLLVDTDGSETLSFVIGGVPQGVIPTSTVAGGVTYIGNGTWSVTAAALPTLELPPVPNFSGENPYSTVTVRAVTQEIDGDDASSPQWPVTITVNPIINLGTVDGLDNWSLGATVAEGALEAGGDISLASAANHGYVDDDGSETVVSYTFDLSNLIANAGIADRLDDLQGAGADLDDLVANHISGVFTYNFATGTITVLAANISGVALDGTLFRDSNQDFSIPVSALVRDTAIIGGGPVSVDKIEMGSFNVDLIGTADTPTAFASSVSGSSGSQIALSVGGVSTDTDGGLGRTPSEDIYYVMSVTNPGTAPALGFTDGAGNIIGLDNGDGTWIFTPAEIAVLHITSPDGVTGTADLRLTTIAVENDGDTASNSANFSVTLTAGTGGPGGTAPLPPTVSIGTNSGNEDGSITLNVTAAPAVGDTSNPNVSVMISNIPAGAQVEGARFNPDTGRWVASAAAVNAGTVRIIPPADFSGTMNITIEAVATSASLQRATTGAPTVPIAVDPVADGVGIAATPDAGIEDTPIDLNLTLSELDVDGSEVIGDHVYLRLSDGATVVGGYPVVLAGDGDATIDGTNLVGFIKVPVADVPNLQILPAANWHGAISVEVASYSTETVDPTPDADNTELDVATFTINVTAVADAPNIMAPVSVSGVEDTAITITGLSASLADTVVTNGAEVLSVKISGVPQGSRFSAGSNNGDGSWTIPVAALPSLQITPPLNYSGTMTLTLTAIALELANGDEAQSAVNFDVVVAPRADSVEILAENVAVDTSGSALLELNVRMADDNGSNPGENPAESIRITFTSVPTGVSLVAADGGAFSNPSSGTWVFTGSETQANAIEAAVGPTATGGTYSINLSAVTLDGADTLATAVTDSFQLTVPQVLAGNGSPNSLTGGPGTQLLFGLGGIDTLNGGADADRLVGGTGADSLTGGGGADVFGYGLGDLGTGVDTVTDFTNGLGGDGLDIAALLSGFDAGSSILSDFVRVSQASGNSTIRVDADGGGNSFQDLVVLQGVTGLDLDAMRTNGNLIV